MLIEYESNNSGGHWWLEDEDWKALEDAGWSVKWGGLWFCKSDFSFGRPEPSYSITECEGECQGHRVYQSFEEAIKGERWLGSIAKEAEKEFTSMKECLKEFEHITGKDVSEEGCNCCGPPHYFHGENKGKYVSCSGEGCLYYLYENVPSNLREATELLNEK